MPPVVINLRKTEDRRDVIHRAVQALSEGQLVVFPTETVYGLAASARSAAGVRRIYEVKGREWSSPLTLAIRGVEDALDYAPGLTRAGRRLARRCWPGPVTLVVPHGDQGSLIQQLPREVREAVAPRGEVGLRTPAHPVVLEVLQMIAGPLALTSANRSGHPAGVSAQDAERSLGSAAALILDDGPSRYGQASTVVRAAEGGLECLREGVVPMAALQRLASMMIVLCCTGNTCRSPMAEALLRRLLAERLGCPVDEVEGRGIIVTSAGIAASPGGQASPQAVSVMKARGLNLSNHASQQLSENLVRDADLVLTMTSGHRQAIVGRWPESAERVKTLRADEGDIDDPIGAPEEMYRHCAEQIECALRQRVAELDLNAP